MARWRFPSLTIHKIVTTGSSQGSVIPHKVRGVISMRLVPDQDLSQMISVFKQTLHEHFATFNSDNKLDVVVDHQADWWLGDPENRGFKALERAVADEWGIPPIYIREVPSPFLCGTAKV
jgi:di- and tripeptidase